MNRKDAAVSFLKTAGMGETDEAYANYIAPGFIHHNQYFKGDRESLKTAMGAAHKASGRDAERHDGKDDDPHEHGCEDGASNPGSSHECLL